uniref:Uncharacterized protein n=1 Tax=Rhizophora mucronata TaxID=61149 RepID=A0A2P2N3A4_RHIMU
MIFCKVMTVGVVRVLHLTDILYVAINAECSIDDKGSHYIMTFLKIRKLVISAHNQISASYN